VAVESPTYAPSGPAPTSCSNPPCPWPGGGSRLRGGPGGVSGRPAKGCQGGRSHNLHNPSAKMLNNDALANLLEKAEARGTLVLVDEVYREMAHGRTPKAAFELGGNSVTTNGLSKLWGLGGLRIGWLIGRRRGAKGHRCQAVLLLASAHSADGLGHPGHQEEGVVPQTRPRPGEAQPSWIRDWAAEERRVEMVEPDGCLYLLLHLPDGMDDERFSERLLKRYRTAVCPGRYFGEAGSIRLTYSCETEDLSIGLAQISDTLDRS